MREEAEQKVVTLIVDCGKLTEQELRKALAKLMEQMKAQKQGTMAFVFWGKAGYGSMDVISKVYMNNGKQSVIE